MFQELEQVALTEDLPDHGLKAGDIGMILHIYKQGYEVEFVTLNGDLVAIVYPSQIRAFTSNEIANVRRVQSL